MKEKSFKTNFVNKLNTAGLFSARQLTFGGGILAFLRCEGVVLLVVFLRCEGVILEVKRTKS